MKTVLLALSVLALSACGSSSDSKKSGAPTGTGEKLVSVVTRDDCRGGVALDLKNSNGWHTVFQSSSMTSTMYFQFDRQGTLHLTNECEFSGKGRLSTTVQARYRDNGSTIEVLDDAQNEEKGSDMTCNVSVAAGSFNYAFEERCLVFADGRGNKMYLLSTR